LLEVIKIPGVIATVANTEQVALGLVMMIWLLGFTKLAMALGAAIIEAMVAIPITIKVSLRFTDSPS
jgi:hypothetical protein